LLTAGGNLVMSPFVIHGLGVQRYGLYVLAGTITAFISGFNGGLASTAGRYFPVYAGADDKVSTTKMLTTMMAMVLVLGAVLTLADWFVSPLIVGSLSMSKSLRPSALFLFRTLGILITFSLSHQLVQAVANSRQRFDRTTQAGLLCYVLWVVGIVWVVRHHDGLKGIAVIYVAQQLLATAVIAPVSVRYLSWRGVRWLERDRLKEMLSFSAKLQVTSWAALVNSQVDAIAIGTVLSVRTFGFYNTGTSLAGQLTSVPNNALWPGGVHLGNSLGRDGPEKTFNLFMRMQRMWVVAIAGWTAVGMGASYFGVIAWLGPRFHLGGVVAVVTLLGALPFWSVALLLAYINVMRQAGIEMRFGLAMMLLNLLFTVPLALAGAVPVAAGLGATQLLGALYLERMVRRRMGVKVPSFIRQLPLARAALAGLVTMLLELVMKPYIDVGAIGLLECVPPALVGLGVFGALMFGPARFARTIGWVVRNRRLPDFV
jgi:O-antigen/teichoic acid export membrane protein